MPSVRVARTLNAKPEEIWPILADASRWPEWMPGLESSTVTNGKEGLGRRQHLNVSYGGRRGEIDLEITQWEPTRKIGWIHRSQRIQGMEKELARDIQTIVTLTPTGAGTEMTFDGSWESVGLMGKMLGKTVVQGPATSMFEKAAGNIERLAQRKGAARR